MRIALTQSNLDRAADWINEVSHPESERYGQHWTASQVAQAFAPSDETIDAVGDWLRTAGVEGERVKQTGGRSWLSVNVTVQEAENLLRTKYHVYEHEETGQPHVACEEYSIPASLKHHIDFVYPSVHFDAKVLPPKNQRRGLHDLAQSRAQRRDSSTQAKSVGAPGSASLPKLGQWLPSDGVFTQLANCSHQITPWCLRLLYKFPPGSSANRKNSFGVVEYTPQAYVPADLDLFFQNFSKQQVGNRPVLKSIDGGYPQQDYMGFGYNGESDLDFEYAMTLLYPQNVTLYQVGDLYEGASFNNFLDAIDGSYCTYEGGDDPTQDGIYPDAEGYNQPETCGAYDATKVISTSYSYNEHDLTPFYTQRQCNEYMKLGLMGVSVLYSSGDYGVAGNGDVCINGTGLDAPYINGTRGGSFNPSFPGTCPYITSVGATQVINGTNLLTTFTQPEKACETVIYSGGGFSNYFPLPDYQSNAVRSWFQNYPPPYGADKFNNSQQTRGYPDISANGAKYVVVVNGKFGLAYGTSASSPTLGSILTLINEARYNLGKTSIGFINPVAYQHPEVFNDITLGSNPGCATNGFSASPGWDPVTGLGTPDFIKMLSLWLRLP